jgi:hypothetical protein
MNRGVDNNRRIAAFDVDGDRTGSGRDRNVVRVRLPPRAPACDEDQARTDNDDSSSYVPLPLA